MVLWHQDRRNGPGRSHRSLEQLGHCISEGLFLQDRLGILLAHAGIGNWSRVSPWTCTKRYKKLIHELFPKARIVADKFHILKMTYGDDNYETVQVPKGELATFVADIAKLDAWIEEDLTEQKRLPGVG